MASASTSPSPPAMAEALELSTRLLLVLNDTVGEATVASVRTHCARVPPFGEPSRSTMDFVLDVFEGVGVLAPALRMRRANSCRGLVSMVPRPCPTLAASASILHSCARELDAYLARRSDTFEVRPLRTEMVAKAIVCEFAQLPPHAALLAADVARAASERMGASAEEVATTAVCALGALGALVGAGYLAAEAGGGSDGRLTWSGPSLATAALVAHDERQRRPSSSAQASARTDTPAPAAAAARAGTLTSVFKQVKRLKAGGASCAPRSAAAVDPPVTPLKRAPRIGGGCTSKRRLEVPLVDTAVPAPPGAPAFGSQPAALDLAAVADVDAAALAAHTPPTAGCRRALEAAFDAETGATVQPLFFTSPERAATAPVGSDAVRVGAKRSLDRSELDCELETFASLLFDAPPLDALEAFAHAVDEVVADEQRRVAARDGPAPATPPTSGRDGSEGGPRPQPPTIAARSAGRAGGAMRLTWHLGPRRSAAIPPVIPRQALKLFTDDPTTSAVRPRVLHALAQQGWMADQPACSKPAAFHSPSEPSLAANVLWDGASVARLVELFSPSDELTFGDDFEADTQRSTCASASVGAAVSSACDDFQLADGRTAGSEPAESAPPKLSLGGHHRYARAPPARRTSATLIRQAHAARLFVATNGAFVTGLRS